MMSDRASIIISKAADVYLEIIISKLIFKLKRVDQSLRSSPDNGLNNLWEDICVQKQTERWDGYNLLENYLEAEISLLVDNLSEHVLMILSYDEFEKNDFGINIDLINEKVLETLYFEADNYNNKRIERYLYDVL